MKITFQTSPLVWIVVRGEPREGRGNREDGGLVGELHNHLTRNRIFYARVGGVSAPGFYSFGFHVDDAPSVIAWLKLKGVIEEECEFVHSSAEWKAAEATT